MTTGSDDATALRRELRDAHARIVALEQQLVAARRLESLGRLTLGVADDFRNVMAAIGVQSELLLDAASAETPLARRVQAIHRWDGGQAVLGGRAREQGARDAERAY